MNDGPVARAAALLCSACLVVACGGGSGTGPGGGGSGWEAGPGNPSGGTTLSSTMALTVDGGDVATSDVTAGVDSGSDTSVIAAAGAATIRLAFPGTATGTFSSGAAAGGTVTYLDGSGNVFDAADGVPGSSCTITVTRHSGGRVTGTFSATVASAGGSTHTVAGTFDAVAPAAAATNRPYQGRYIGFFRATYRVCASTCGPELSKAFRVVLELEYDLAQWQAQEYEVTWAQVGDPYFGCTGGCTPAAEGSWARLPYPAGGSASSITTISLMFSNGRKLETTGAWGYLLTSATGGVLSNGEACHEGSSSDCWTGWQVDPYDSAQDWERVAVPADSQIGTQSWWLARTP